MSLFRILPTAGKEPSTRCCLTIQTLAAASSCGSMKMKLRACAKDFRTKAVSLKWDEAGAGRARGWRGCAGKVTSRLPPEELCLLPAGPRVSASSPVTREGSACPRRAAVSAPGKCLGTQQDPMAETSLPAWTLPVPWQRPSLELKAFLGAGPALPPLTRAEDVPCRLSTANPQGILCLADLQSFLGPCSQMFRSLDPSVALTGQSEPTRVSRLMKNFTRRGASTQWDIIQP